MLLKPTSQGSFGGALRNLCYEDWELALHEPPPLRDLA
jgi:hypothetical protein